jgi:hypothetical protein
MLWRCSTWEERLRAAVPGREVGASVVADWNGWLPEAKMHAFQVYADDFESRYLMLSVSLNEAIGLRESGLESKSLQLVVITPGLCERLTKTLEGMLCSLEEHVIRFGLVPSVAPLRAENFHGLRGQRCARKNSLLSAVLLSKRSQYLSKVSTLREMAGNIGDDFCHAAAELLSLGGLGKSALCWAAMDNGHFDLNSCLRESMILLKCFLRVLPNQQLQEFQKSVSRHIPALNSELGSDGSDDANGQTPAGRLRESSGTD